MTDRLELPAMLRELIDGSRPLPPPHPQRLSFPNDERMIEAVAEIASFFIDNDRFKLGEEEGRHLLFKMAAWVTKRGLGIEELHRELFCHLCAVELATAAKREWLTSRAGFGWCIRRFDRWRAEMRRLARETAEKPLVVAELGLPGFSLVELTNPAHIHAEGEALGHCMSWSVNTAALKKHGYPAGADALDCLTYVIKQRSGELRIFSLRDETGLPMMTLAYSPRKAAIVHTHAPQAVRARVVPVPHAIVVCATMSALSDLVMIKKVEGLPWRGCKNICPKGDWCFVESAAAELARALAPTSGAPVARRAAARWWQ